jgi:hypothetical protein
MAEEKEYEIAVSIKYVYNPPTMTLKVMSTSEKSAIEFAKKYVADHSLKFEVIKNNK